MCNGGKGLVGWLIGRGGAGAGAEGGGGGGIYMVDLSGPEIS